MIENFITDDLNHLKGRCGGDRVDENIAVDTNEVLGVQNAIFILWNRHISLVSFIDLNHDHPPVEKREEREGKDSLDQQYQ